MWQNKSIHTMPSVDKETGFSLLLWQGSLFSQKGQVGVRLIESASGCIFSSAFLDEGAKSVLSRALSKAGLSR